MAKASIWIPFYVMDYRKDTGELTLEEDCAYRRALDECWMSQGSIPADLEKLRRLLRMERPEFKRCAWLFSDPRFFYEVPDGLRNRRSDLEIEKWNNLKAAKSRGAAATNAQRYGEQGKPQSHSVSHSDTDSVSHKDRPLPSPSPLPSNSLSLSQRKRNCWALFPDHRIRPKSAGEGGGSLKVMVNKGERAQKSLFSAMDGRPDYPWEAAIREERHKMPAGTAREVRSFLDDLPVAGDLLQIQEAARAIPMPQEERPLTEEELADGQRLWLQACKKIGYTPSSRRTA